MNRYQKELEDRKRDHLLRELPSTSASIDFFSNDYLGLARSKDLYQAIENEYTSLLHKSTGSTGSRLLSGNSGYALELESQIARFHGAEDALVYSTGYAANVGLISCLGKRGVHLVCDELIHASMIDGVRLSQGTRHKFKHNDPDSLDEKLAGIEGEKIVLIETVYSMDGDISPLEGILRICKKHEAELIVDEAHAVGLLGKKGEGLASLLGLQKELLASVVTYGKAMGVHGAAILSEKWLKDYLVNFSRSFIYSTAPSNHQLSSIKCAYQIVENAAKERELLQSNIDYFKTKRVQTNSLHWINSDTAIQSLIIPGNEEVINAAEKLKENDIAILPIRSPSVPEGEERLRISLHAYNTHEEIDLLFVTIGQWKI